VRNLCSYAVGGGPLERAAARICREAGARVTTNTRVADLNIPSVHRLDDRRIEVIANGLPLLGGCQLAVDTTLVSPLTREGKGSPDGGTGGMRGRLCRMPAATRSEFTPELVASGRCRLVVLVLEIGGRWSQETCTFLRLLASHRARQAPQILQQAVSTALLHRWSAMLTHAAATAYAASLQGCDGASEANLEGTPPSFSELRPDPATGFCHLGTDQVKNCQPWTCGTSGDRPEEKLSPLTELLQHQAT